MLWTVEYESSKRQTQSHEVSPSSASRMESSLQLSSMKSAAAHSTSGAGLVLHNSSAAQMASSAATKVLPVYLVNSTGAVNAPVPSLYRYVYPVAVGSQPIVHSPWLVASAVGMQVS